MTSEALDRNKTALTHVATATAAAWMDNIGCKVIESVSDRPGTVLYIDSPYIIATRSDATYAHEFVSPSMFSERDDHARLRSVLGRFQSATVICSHYDCPEVRALYEGWQIDENYQDKTIGRAGRGPVDPTVAPEIIIHNRSK